ncbi:MAG: sigma-70 family RNA polymerase sigma factor [Zetaproteobacteria bacterium]|nr:MAG: sigma-70 family RNA polymerase sigma factor [Zetaproteobacteria bacterium]
MSETSPIPEKHRQLARYERGSLTPLDIWYRELRRIPRLTREEEQELTRRWVEQRDLAAAQRLVLGNLHAVAAIAREYRHFGLPEMDLIQEGTIGLMKAIQRFDPARGFRLMTYAAWWVRAEIHDYILRSWSIVKMGTNKLQRRIFAGLQKARHAIAAIEGRLDEEVANEYGISNQEFHAIANAFLQRDVSLDQEQGEGRAMITALPSPEATPEEQALNNDWNMHQHQRLEHALGQLPERDRLIVRRRHLLDEPATLRELADELGVSIERVRQLERRALKRLRELLSEPPALPAVAEIAKRGENP